jgi:hypothetical protein
VAQIAPVRTGSYARTRSIPETRYAHPFARAVSEARTPAAFAGQGGDSAGKRVRAPVGGSPLFSRTFGREPVRVGAETISGGLSPPISAPFAPIGAYVIESLLPGLHIAAIRR